MTTLPATGLPTASHANTFHTTTTCTFITVWPNHPTSPITTHFPPTTPYDRPTSTDNYPCTHPSTRRRPRATTREIYPLRSSTIQASQSPARHTASLHEAHSTHLLVGERTSSRPHKGSSIGHPAPIFASINLQILSALTTFTLFISPSGSITRQHPHNALSNPQPNHALLDNWKTGMSRKEGIKTSH